MGSDEGVMLEGRRQSKMSGKERVGKTETPREGAGEDAREEGEPGGGRKARGSGLGGRVALGRGCLEEGWT